MTLQHTHTHTPPSSEVCLTLSCAHVPLPCGDDFDMCFYGISGNRILHGYYDRDLPISLICTPVLFFCIIPTCSTSAFISLLVGGPEKHWECCLQHPVHHQIISDKGTSLKLIGCSPYVCPYSHILNKSIISLLFLKIWKWLDWALRSNHDHWMQPSKSQFGLILIIRSCWVFIVV